MTNLKRLLGTLPVFGLLVCSAPSKAYSSEIRPVAEYEKMKRLVMVDPFMELLPYLLSLGIPNHQFKDHDQAALEMKTEIIKNLPQDVQLVILHIDDSQAHRRKLLGYLERVLGAERAKTVSLVFKGGVETGREKLGLFWARDSFPIPLWNNDRQLLLADIRPEKQFSYAEPDAVLAGPLSGKIVLANRPVFHGGNFLSTSTGTCFSVKSPAKPGDKANSIDEAFFKGGFGCKEVHLLPQIGGIGHIDERIKILSDRKILTDSPEYLQSLTKLGFDVTQVPRAPGGEWRTYLNSVLVNGTIFVPVYDAPQDENALAVYRSSGLKVVPVKSKLLSDEGRGSLHCFTATYP